ncbi:MAG: hypothetical protein ACKVWV_07440 [Planctomycetota bacterium]
MDPIINISGAAASTRAPAASELAQVLADGRIVAGEVIETLDGGTVVLGIAGRRVTAETQVKLEPGQRFLARAEGHGDGLVLRLVAEGSHDESLLLTALRTVIGRELPAGELLESLQALGRTTPNVASPALRELLESLALHAFEPLASGTDLAALVSRSGLGTEAALLASATGDLPEQLVDDAASLEIARAWIERAKVEGAIPGDAEALQRIERILAAAITEFARASVAAPAARDTDPLTLLVRILRASWTRALAATPHEADNATGPSAAPVQFDARFLRESGTVEKLLALFGFAPRTLLAAGVRDFLDRDLKSKLLRAASELNAGTERELVDRSIDALEAEQLLHIARNRFGEPWHLTLAVPDGDRFASAHLLFAGKRASDAERETDDEGSERIEVAVDFSQLGPIRADVFLRPASILLRLSVANAGTVEQLEAQRGALCEVLALDGRAVQISIVHDAHAELVPHAPAAHFLRDHPLMDLSA